MNFIRSGTAVAEVCHDDRRVDSIKYGRWTQIHYGAVRPNVPGKGDKNHMGLVGNELVGGTAVLLR
ncbi:MAG: hypothetical protein H6657_29195 [Ardenticatenaceae bacterium]|nr:hypothetical protein [Ardenticatenaceae bacterium]